MRTVGDAPIFPAQVSTPRAALSRPESTAQDSSDGVHRSSAFEVHPVRLEPQTASTNFFPAKDLLGALTFGAAEIHDWVHREITKKPITPIARVMFTEIAHHASDADSWTKGIAGVVRLLDHCRRPNGTYDLGALCRIGGSVPELCALLVKANAAPKPQIANYTSVARTIDVLARVLPKAQALELVDQLVRNDSLIPRGLACIDAMADRIPEGRFKGEGLIAVQHLFPSLVPLVEAMIKRGMRPQDIHILGSPYSTNPMVVSYLRLLGVDVVPGTTKPSTTSQYTEERNAEIDQFIKHVEKLPGPGPSKGYAILDDGGKLHRRLGKSTMRSRVLRGVEQTTRGLTEIQLDPFWLSTVKVADSEAKKAEGELIGWALTDACIHELRQLGVSHQNLKTTLVSGGTVGLWTAKWMRSAGFDVLGVVDSSEEKRNQVTAAGFTAIDDLTHRAKETELILSSTGKQALDLRTVGDFKGILGSGSSAQIEGDPLQIQSARLLNALHPVNFKRDGFERLLEGQRIGMTQALLLSGLAQEAGDIDLVALNTPDQEVIEATWRATGGNICPALPRAPRPLQRPDASGHPASPFEWLTYLRNLEGEVDPVPTFGHLAHYFFQDGPHVRVVDVQEGISRIAPFAKVPTERIYLKGTNDDAVMVVCAEDASGEYIRVAQKKPNEAMTFGPRLPGGPRVASYATDFVNNNLMQGSMAFEGKEEVVVVSTDALDSPRVMPKVKGIDSRFAFSPSGSVLWQISLDPPRVYELARGREPIALKAALPEDAARVSTVFSMDTMLRPTVVVQTKSGAQKIIALDEQGGSVKPVLLETLPPGSLLRHIDAKAEHPWLYRFSYSEPGMLAEPDAYKHSDINLWRSGN